MVKVTCIKDLENISDSGAKHISKTELNRLLTSYQIDNISYFGSIFVIENKTEFENYSAMGMSEPINQNFEFTEKYHIKKCNREDTYLFGCIIVCDDFAVDILVNKSLLTDKQIKRFSSSIQNTEYEINLEDF